MLNLKAFILLVVACSLSLTLPASIASANNSAFSTSINAEFSTNVGAESETAGENANTNGKQNGDGNHSSAHSSDNSTTVSSPSVPTISTTSSPSAAPQNFKSKTAETGPASTRAPAGGLLAEVGSVIEAAAKSVFLTESFPSSSSGNKSAPTTKTPHSDVAEELPQTISTVGAEEHDANEPLHKFCTYMKPICDSIDHISPKQMTRLQSQFKHFVQLTNGRLSSCFLEHYFFDPADKPVTKTDLSVICSSKSAYSNTADSYRSFQNCAVKNWDPQVDKELDKIAEARLNRTKMHHHASGAANGAIGLSQDDDDEFNILNDVVNKSLDAEKSSNNTSSDLKPQQQQHHYQQQQQQHQHSNSSSSEGLLGKIHSVLTGISNNSASSHSATSKPNGPEQMSTRAPLLAVEIPSQAPTKQSGSLIDLLFGGGSTEKPSYSSSSSSTTKSPTLQSSPPPIGSVSSSAAPLLSISVQGKNETNSSKAPAFEAAKVTTLAPAKLKSTTSVAATTPSPTPSTKPLETIEQVLKRQEKEKQQFEDKLRAEREKVLKQLRKKQDEIDAQNAIRALQMQRQSSSAASDQRLHQLEHQRQMALDPIGHTIKHQQYELSKQQRASGK